MDIDFPLVLSWTVLVCGAVWLLDVLILRPRRLALADSIRQGDHTEADIDRSLREPILVEYARSFFPVLLLVLVLRSFLAEPYQIPSESMVPTLAVGDFVLVNKYAYGLRLPVIKTKIVDVGAPARGDIMVFVPPHDRRSFIKRVIGLPGDKVRYENKALYINGERVGYEFEEEFMLQLPGGRLRVRAYIESLDGRDHSIYRYPRRNDGAPKEWLVPENAYFMMGDNRGRSEDSRAWGFAEESNIVGKAVAVWMHKEPGWHLPTFARNRWLTQAPNTEIAVNTATRQATTPITSQVVKE